MRWRCHSCLRCGRDWGRVARVWWSSQTPGWSTDLQTWFITCQIMTGKQDVQNETCEISFQYKIVSLLVVHYQIIKSEGNSITSGCTRQWKTFTIWCSVWCKETGQITDNSIEFILIIFSPKFFTSF